MSEAIAIALISGLCVGIPSVITTLLSNKNNNKLTLYRIERLEEKVDIHNHVIERVYKLEQQNAVQEEEIKVSNHRINDLESYHKPN